MENSNASISINNNSTYFRKMSKYKRSIIKKSIECAKLCNMDIFLTMIDSKGNYTFFSSSLSPQEFIKNKLLSIQNKAIIQTFSCEDVNILFIFFSMKI